MERARERKRMQGEDREREGERQRERGGRVSEWANEWHRESFASPHFASTTKDDKIKLAEQTWSDFQNSSLPLKWWESECERKRESVNERKWCRTYHTRNVLRKRRQQLYFMDRNPCDVRHAFIITFCELRQSPAVRVFPTYSPVATSGAEPNAMMSLYFLVQARVRQWGNDSRWTTFSFSCTKALKIDGKIRQLWRLTTMTNDVNGTRFFHVLESLDPTRKWHYNCVYYFNSIILRHLRELSKRMEE